MYSHNISELIVLLGIRKRNMPRIALFAYGGSYLCRLGSGELWCMVHVV